MERYRRKKMMIIIVLLLAVAGLTIGFAAYTTVLTISAQANVVPSASSFSVKFSTRQNSLNEGAVTSTNKTSGVVTTNGIINNNLASPTISNLSATFTSPGQYAEYTFYARNEGQYRAYLNNVNFGMKVCGGKDATSSLVQEACNSITMTVTVGNNSYTQTTAITGHSLEKNTGERVVVRIEYASNGALADGAFNVSFGNITMVYSSIDDSTFVPPVIGSDTNTKTINYIMKQGAVSDSSVDFDVSPSNDVNNTAYIVNGTQTDTNPIYYYRGNVTNNNVAFANFCWKIVRTTETGGVKLIYNGFYEQDEYQKISSNNYTNVSNDPTYPFSFDSSTLTWKSTNKNKSTTSKISFTVASAGDYKLYYTNSTGAYEDRIIVYLNGTRIAYTSSNDFHNLPGLTPSSVIEIRFEKTSSSTSGTGEFVFSLSKKSGNKVNHCDNTKEASQIGKSYFNINNYSIDDVRYIYPDGTDSVIKGVIDSWYAKNMIPYTNKLEDTPWCNDRSIVNISDWGTFFGAYSRLYGWDTPIAPTLECGDEYQMTVGAIDIDKHLKYPVAMLTADEMTLAGNGTNGGGVYLGTGVYYWTLTPELFSLEDVGGTLFYVYFSGIENDHAGPDINIGVRPSISLAPNTEISGGDGSVTNPYVIN